MGYRLTMAQGEKLFERLSAKYDIYAPKRFEKQGRYSDTDIVRYAKISSPEEIVFDEKSDFSAKEVLTPITQTILYFTEDEYREAKPPKKAPLIFLRPCDINAFEHQDKIYLENGGISDLYYKRLRERVKFVLMECVEGFDTCFCVSMGTNKTEDYSAAVRRESDTLLFNVKDGELTEYFAGEQEADFQLRFIEKNQFEVHIPEISDEVNRRLKDHPMWQEYDKRCISCGACTVACPTCTCFTTKDKIYDENACNGERRRIMSSCQLPDFDMMAGGHGFRFTPGQRVRYRVLHKIRDYKARFKDYHMCVGCGRCSDRCPQFINMPATIEKISKAVAEIEATIAEEGENK